MAQQDELLRIILEVTGAEELDNLRAKLEAQKATLAAAAASLGGYSSAAARMDPGVRAAAAAVQQTTNQIGALEKSLGKGSGGMAGFGQSVLQASRGIQDFQAAGLMGIVNNIESIVMAMGGTAGLAGALTLAAVAFQVLGPYIRSVLAEMDTDKVEVFKDRIKEMKDRIGELEKGEIHFGVDTFELDQTKEKLETLMKLKSAADALFSKKTPQEEASGKAFSEAVTEAPGGPDVVKKKVTDQLRRSEERNMGLAEAEAEAARLQDEVDREANEGAGGEQGNGQVNRELLDKLAAAKRRTTEIREKARISANKLRDDMFGGAALGDPARIAEATRVMREAGVDKSTIARAEDSANAPIADDEKLQAEARREVARQQAEKVDSETQFHADQLAEFTAARKRSRAQANRLANPLQGGFDTGRIADRDDAKEALMASGKTEAEAEKWADRVFASLGRSFDQRARARASTSGISLDAARGDLRREAFDREGGRAASQAKQLDPRLSEDIRRSLIALESFGASTSEAMNAVTAGARDFLVSKGMTPEEATAAVAKLAVDEQRQIDSDVMHNELRPERRAAETIGSADFARQVQSAGADEAKTQTDIQKQMLDRLTEMRGGIANLDRRGLTARLGK